MARPVPAPGWTGGLPHVVNDAQHVGSCPPCRRFLRRARRYPQGRTLHRRPAVPARAARRRQAVARVVTAIMWDVMLARAEEAER